MEEVLEKAVTQYFDYLSGRFPVMCASDEFHFLPRAENACRYYDRLEDFSADGIVEFIHRIKAFQQIFSKAAEQESNLENRIDFQILKANTAGILIEFEQIRSWRHNPLLYLKTAFIGFDHALTKPAATDNERLDRAVLRLNAIPRLLNQAIENLNHVPETHYVAALAMVGDCRRYLSEMSKPFNGRQHFKDLTNEVERVSAALHAFDRFLKSMIPIPDSRFSASSIEASLKHHFLSKRSLEEIFEIAAGEWADHLRQLEKLQSNISTKKTWQELYHQYDPWDDGDIDTFRLYHLEILRLLSFFEKHGFMTNDLCMPLELIKTPTYLESVRSPASFAAAFSQHPGEKSYFYITTRLPGSSSREATDILIKRLHREYRFLTAHETIPGHHLLDSVRRRLKSPVRRQIESPLFYEGWAYYAESLLTDYEYIDSPMEHLVDLKRRLWRSARCWIDAGITLGKMDREEAARLLMKTGFTREESAIQINRFQLNPGYQLCYSLGRFEILKLRETWGNRMGKEKFHRVLLEGGELPFHLIEKRFETLFS
jgi:uncharacterized protein (DUF885 family)